MKTLVAAFPVLAMAVLVGCHLIGLSDPASPDNPGDPKATVTDNSRCHVCHINYDDEKLAVDHAKASVGCENCHGLSDDHCNDENNITPPQLMYPKSKVNPSCMICHGRAEIANEALHKPIFDDILAAKKLCTDCHGKEHRLAHRTVRWDKATAKLLEGEKEEK